MITDVKDTITVLLEKEKKRKRRQSQIIIVLLTVCISFLLLRVLLGISIVEGESMSPTISDHSVVIFLRTVSQYEVGDIVIADVNGTEIIKRIESIEEGQVFLRGDNQEISVDSYIFGTVSEEHLVGKVVCVIKIL